VPERVNPAVFSAMLIVSSVATVSRVRARGLMAIATSSAADWLPALSVTVREKVRVVSAATSGAVKVGCAAAGSDSATVVPAVWVHW